MLDYLIILQANCLFRSNADVVEEFSDLKIVLKSILEIVHYMDKYNCIIIIASGKLEGRNG